MSPASGRGHRAWEFLRRLWTKAEEDEIFFMASAVSFNLLVAAIPLALLGIGLTGYVLSTRVGDPVQGIVSLLAENLPQGASGMDLSQTARAVVSGVMARRSGFTLLGAALFVWLATRLVGTLRLVLREIFDVAHSRGIVRGKVFDVQVVVIGVVLLTLNLGVTISLEAVLEYGVGFLGLEPTTIGLAQWLLGHAVALVSIWALFFVVYRYLPARRIPWPTALVAATFAAVAHEALKQGFSWYATDVADYSSTWGNLATVAVLFFWIYYEALVFILGGEVAQVYTMRKASSVQLHSTLNGDPA
ncbi:MAG: YihY/virulence factor BrkB family protein [Gemmatimonadota bacterium]